MQYKLFVFFLSGLILICSFVMYSNIKVQNEFEKFNTNRESEIQGDSLQSSNLWNANFIHVNNNWTITNETYPWCNGKGTEIDPFVIDNVNVTGNGNEIGILIENTRDYFEINNCSISNAEIGIKILNSTNFKIYNLTLYNINGLNAAEATFYNDGPNAKLCAGINIYNCSKFKLSAINIFDLSGGQGGRGSYGEDGSGDSQINGRVGGKGSDTFGIYISNSSRIIIINCSVFNLHGGRGGQGGSGGDRYNTYGMDGGNGGLGGSGGITYGIFINYSFDVSIMKNIIYNLNSGNGGNGGHGGNGDSALPAYDGGNGGHGGQGGNAGILGGIFFLNDKNISLDYNKINNLTSGSGGSGGDGGDGGKGGMGFPPLNAGDGGHGGWGGNGGDSGKCKTLEFEKSLNLNNNWNLLINISNGNYGIGGEGGSGGPHGDGGGGSNGPNGGSGNAGINYPIIGFNLENTNHSISYYNIIYIENNYDNGYYNHWDNGIIGNYWKNYFGIDINPYDGIGDINYTLLGISNANDTKPIIYPLMYPENSDYDGDNLSNEEEFIFGNDGFITNASNPDTDNDNLNDFWEWKNQTNPLNNDTDDDKFRDGLEISFHTKPTDKWWYPMPNLNVVYFKNMITYENQFFVLDFSIQNNGIWKVENVIVIITYESEGLTLYNNSNSPFSLDVDQTIIVQNLSSLIKAVGTYNLKIAIDPINSINETYSSKDGSFRLNNEFDNILQATLTITNGINKTLEIIYIGADDNDDNNDDKKEEKLFDERTIIIIAIVSTIWAVALIIIFTSQKIESTKQKDILKKKLKKKSLR